MPITASPDSDWPQWGQNAQHTGSIDAAGQFLNRIVADIVYDPLDRGARFELILPQG